MERDENPEYKSVGEGGSERERERADEDGASITGFSIERISRIGSTYRIKAIYFFKKIFGHSFCVILPALEI